MKTMTLECDELDYAAIQQAVAQRQRWGILPDGEGDMAGRVLAEICRGWMEMLGIVIGGNDERDE